MAVGITSLVLCAMLTWSLGCTGAYSPSRPPRIWLARLASTSLQFMLWEVPAPAWYTSTMNWSRCWPASTSSAAWTMASASRASRRPVSLWVSAAERLTQTTASTNAGRGRSPEIGKFSAARRLWTPYRALAGTGFSPRGSFSRRVISVGTGEGRGGGNHGLLPCAGRAGPVRSDPHGQTRRGPGFDADGGPQHLRAGAVPAYPCARGRRQILPRPERKGEDHRGRHHPGSHGRHPRVGAGRRSARRGNRAGADGDAGCD